MTNLYRTLVVVVALVVLGATPALATRNQPDQDVPFKVTAFGTEWIDPAAPGCPAGTAWRYFSSGTFEASHLGRGDYFATHCTTFNPLDGTGTFGNGTITYTAANGDTLVMAQEGTFQVNPDFTTSLITVESWVIVGGTGRFVGATGSGTGSGVSDIPGSTTSLGLSGMMAYDASNGSDL